MKNITNFDFMMRTEIVFGKDTELRVGELVKKYGGTKVMIVMDGGGFIKKNGLFTAPAKVVNASCDQVLKYSDDRRKAGKGHKQEK